MGYSTLLWVSKTVDLFTYDYLTLNSDHLLIVKTRPLSHGGDKLRFNDFCLKISAFGVT